MSPDKGWSSDGLGIVGSDVRFWTLADAASILGPPSLTTEQLRALVKILGIAPAGKRRTTGSGISGRHARVYSAKTLILVYEVINNAKSEFSEKIS